MLLFKANFLVHLVQGYSYSLWIFAWVISDDGFKNIFWQILHLNFSPACICILTWTFFLENRINLWQSLHKNLLLLLCCSKWYFNADSEEKALKHLGQRLLGSNHFWSTGKASWSSGRGSWCSVTNSWSTCRDSWSSGGYSWSSGGYSWSSGRNSWSSHRDSWSSDRDSWSLRRNSCCWGRDFWS